MTPQDFLRRLWAPPAFENEEKSRIAGLLNIILWGLAVAGVGLAPAGWLLPDSTIFLFSGLFLVALGLVGQYLMRRGQTSLVSLLVVLSVGGLVTYVLAAYDGLRNPTIAGYILVIIIAGLLTGGRGAIITTVVSQAVMVGLFFAIRQGLIQPRPTTVDYTDLVVDAAVTGLSALMLYLATRSINQALEAARSASRAQVKANWALEASRLALEARTRDLALAAEIGQRLVAVRNLDQLLTEAVELIRARFGLYYTQVYLLDANGRALALRAGTGKVGAELLRRQHRLPMGFGSLNGTAAYEKRPVIVADTTLSSTFRPNSLLPETRSEMSVPLLVGDRVVGVLDLQSSQRGALTADALPAFEALAGQLAIAIENAQLFAEAAESRAEAEEHNRRTAHTGWDQFLNAVDRSERLGYSYDREAVVPLSQPLALPDEHSLAAPLVVAGEQIGQLQIQREAGQAWTEDDAELIFAVARQVAQQVENLRLLAEAQRYRAEAEAASRRLTREGWAEHLAMLPAAETGYLYDHEQVRPLAEAPADTAPADMAPANMAAATLTVPLVVQGEAIGTLDLDNLDQVDEATTYLVTTIADRLGAHLENLRLTAQTETTLAETEDLYQASAELNLAATYEGILDVVRRHTLAAQGAHILSINLFDRPWTQTVRAEAIQSVAFWSSLPPDQTAPMPRHYTVADFPSVDTVLRSDAPAVIENVRTAPALSDPARELFSRVLHAESFVFAPLKVGGQWTGYIGVLFAAPQSFAEADLRRLMALAGQSAVAVNSVRLFEETQAALLETEHLYEASRRLATVADMQEIVTAAVEGLRMPAVNRAVLMLSEFGPDGEMEAMTVTGNWYSGQGTRPSPIGRHYQRYAFALLELFQTPVPVFFDDTLHDPRVDPGMHTIMATQNIRAMAVMPLWLGTRQLGVLILETEVPYHFTEHEIRTYPPLMGQMATHIENLRLFEQAQKRAAELETVAQVSTAASTLLESQRLLQAVVDLAKSAFHLYHTHVYLLDVEQGQLKLAAGAGTVGEQMVAQGWAIPMDRERSLVARVARERRGVIVNDVRAAPDFLSNPLLPETRAELAVPLVAGDRLLGVFDVQASQDGYFTAEDINVYTTLAAQVAIALQNANLYAEQAATVVRLRELDQLKSAFLANMSHELRTPLNSVLGFAQVILEGLDGPLTDNMTADLGLIEKNGQHLLRLINDVLDMAKIEAGRVSLMLERLNPRELLEDVLETSSSLAREKALALKVESFVAPDLTLLADHTRLRQVLLNVIGNAIKFTESGGITVSLHQRGAKLQIHIQDTGIGIPTDKLESIFEAFSQVDSSTTRKAGGTGLGLPISRRLVELHGGRLWAESQGATGGGSTFFVELPLPAANAD